MSEAEGKRALRIAIVEDTPLFMDIVREILIDAGHSICVEVGSVSAALQEIPNSDPDLVLLDLNLPDGNGMEVARALVPLSPQMRVVVFTDFAHACRVGELPPELRFRCSFILKTSVVSRVNFAQLIQQASEYAVIDPELAKVSDRFSRIELLSDRQLEILSHVADGQSNAVVAEKLAYSEKTIEYHLRQIYQRLELNSDEGKHQRVSAVLLYLDFMGGSSRKDGFGDTGGPRKIAWL